MIYSLHNPVIIRRYLFLLFLGIIGCKGIESERPNIIVIMVDDMGYSDIAPYGGEIQTPNLEKLADNGIRFTQFYNAGRCVPSRASLLTGQYPHKVGLGYMTAIDYDKPGYRADLGKNSVTIAEVLKGSGYNTYMAGKWHLNYHFDPEGPKHNWPLQRGFEHFFGTLIGVGSYWDPLSLVEGNEYVDPGEDFYYTEAISHKVVNYLEDHDPNNPFFMYVAYTAPHFPLHARDEEIKRQEGKFDKGWDQLRKERYERMVELGIMKKEWGLSTRHPKSQAWEETPDKEWEASRMETFAATLDHVDQGIGLIIEKLEVLGQLDNTLIFFLSDNGGDYTSHRGGMINSTGKPWAIMKYVPLYTRGGEIVVAGDLPGVKLGPETTYGSYGRNWANLSNTPFRKFKTFAHEGGIATPLIVHWPDGMEAKNEWRETPAHIIDIMATCLELAETDYPELYNGNEIKSLDGESLIPILFKDDANADPRSLFWEHQGNRAARKGDWKIVSAQEDKSDWELFNLKNDRTEINNLADSLPEKVRELEELYNQWALECNVLPWEDLNIYTIPPSDNPLTRSEEEMKEVEKHWQTVQEILTNLRDSIK